jgi:hypothetical protein
MELLAINIDYHQNNLQQYQWWIQRFQEEVA